MGMRLEALGGAIDQGNYFLLLNSYYSIILDYLLGLPFFQNIKKALLLGRVPWKLGPLPKFPIISSLGKKFGEVNSLFFFFSFLIPFREIISSPIKG